MFGVVVGQRKGFFELTNPPEVPPCPRGDDQLFLRNSEYSGEAHSLQGRGAPFTLGPQSSKHAVTLSL